ncbi:MAG: sigma-54-dependent Fis family transcriptional regulator [Acidobacteria bacterium]|nr:sigma-54-dependent Fis family transcriptional regulator [Acidobacteriota bacterium]
MNILILDDEPVIREVLRAVLERNGWETREAGTASDGLALLSRETFDLLLLDLMLPDRSGMEVLAEVRTRYPELPVVVVTAYTSVESAIAAMREGAFHYLPKPFRNDEVVHVVKQALEKRRLVAENRALKAKLEKGGGGELSELVGRSLAMEKVFETARQAAAARSTILVVGESGTGKELVAKALHRLSPRAAGPFVTVHSGALPPDLLESNLFGHTRGSFTGAVADKKGLFKAADGGTIFFDEIGTVPLETQAKLLRVLQEREFLPVGAVEPQRADVRVIAATNADLSKMVQEGRFREDLFYRLSVITIPLPPLRERKEDIPLLVEALVARAASENGRSIPSVTPSAMKALFDHDWPGNVRELENALERALVLGHGVIDLDQLPDSVRRSVPRPNLLPQDGLSFKDAVASYEKSLLSAALHRAGGVQKRAAELLRLKPTTLNEMLKRYGMLPRDARESDPVLPAQRLERSTY